MAPPGIGYDQGLIKSLDAARAEAATPLSREEVSEIVWSIVRSMEGDVSALDLKMYNELEALARYIQTTKQEIAAIRPDEINDRHIPTATDELDAVVGATEKATNTIMDTCDIMANLASAVDSEIGNQLIDCTTRIFEACNFQDITGQRITKVVKALKHIEAKVDALVAAFGEEVKRHHAVTEETSSAPETEDDSYLLHGPQLPGNAIDQDEIDRLLASFG